MLQLDLFQDMPMRSTTTESEPAFSSTTGSTLAFGFLRQPDRQRIERRLAEGRALGLMLFEIGNFSFFRGLYGEDVARHVTGVVTEELRGLARTHLSHCDLLFLDSAERGRHVVLFGDFDHDAMPDLSMTFRLHLRGVVKVHVLKLTGRAMDIHAGYAIVSGHGPSLEQALYTALCDAQQTAMGGLDGGKLSLLKEFREIIERPSMGVAYQPIVDFRTGSVFGWEALARGPQDSHFQSPSVLFDFAEEVDQVFALERVCRETAIRRFGPMAPASEDKMLFLNIHPRTLVDPQFCPGETMKLLRESGLEPHNVVFEITERHSIRDFTLFHRTLEHYRSQGYRVAVDDVGTGYSGLQSIAEIRPDFIKIDMSLIRQIDTNPVKRALIETFVAFSDKIGCRIIAEGIETPTEMSSLISMGVHFGQGYHLRRPAFPKPGLEPSVASRILSVSRRLGDEWKCSIPLRDLVEPVRSVGPQTRVSEVKQSLELGDSISAVVVADKGTPLGLLMSHHLDRALSTPYGMSLYYGRSVEKLMDASPLVAEGSTPVEIVAKQAVGREKFKIYDCIIVTENGKLSGIVSVQKMLDTLACVQVEMAKGANPLTGLPGNVAIELELERRVRTRQPSSFVYVDLDNFKIYNDTYGFRNGDAIILLLARILSWAAKRHGGPKDEFIGHVGGDDFVIMSSPDRAERICRAVTRVFGRLIRLSYCAEDRQRGTIRGKDRHTGEERDFPLVTVSLAIIDCDGGCDPSDIARRSAEMKKYAKTFPGNAYVRDRRTTLAPLPAAL